LASISLASVKPAAPTAIWLLVSNGVEVVPSLPVSEVLRAAEMITSSIARPIAAAAARA
jgi:hypothetical protein